MIDEVQKKNMKSTVIRERLAEARHMQMMEGNPLTAAELEMFEMFDREGWSHDKCTAFILAKYQAGRSDVE